MRVFLGVIFAIAQLSCITLLYSRVVGVNIVARLLLWQVGKLASVFDFIFSAFGRGHSVE